jgi:hypothetical protein
MPASSERKEFEPHLLRTIADLNRWLDPSNRRIRFVQRAITWGLGLLATVALAIFLAALQIRDPALTFPLGLAVGVVVAVVSLVLGTLFETSVARAKRAERDGGQRQT